MIINPAKAQPVIRGELKVSGGLLKKSLFYSILFFVHAAFARDGLLPIFSLTSLQGVCIVKYMQIHSKNERINSTKSPTCVARRFKLSQQR